MDPVAAWREAQTRVIDLCDDLDSASWATTVPACPDWTVHDLVAHMVGLDADVLAGEEADDHNPGWTQAQVDARRERTGPEVLEEWRLLAPALETYMREQDARPLGDVTIHEQDLRSALSRPGARDTEAIAMIRDRMAERLGSAITDLPTLELRSEDWTWRSHDGEPETMLESTGFDLFRALCSRRTADQLRSWVVAGDVEPYLDAFGGLGSLPDQPLPE